VPSIYFDDPNVPDDVITIGQAARLIPPARGAENTNPSALARKARRKGLFRLWKHKVNGQLYASRAEVQSVARFLRVYESQRAG
jgi:hypothetical protein